MNSGPRMHVHQPELATDEELAWAKIHRNCSRFYGAAASSGMDGDAQYADDEYCGTPDTWLTSSVGEEAEKTVSRMLSLSAKIATSFRNITRNPYRERK
jgi:hypothetical protein